MALQVGLPLESIVAIDLTKIGSYKG